MHDVIVVGARCAGSPVALQLARKGHRVLVVDRDDFPSDTLSTHFLWPRGASYLNRWGVLDKVLAQTPSARQLDITVEGITLSGEIPLALTRERLSRLHGDAGDGAVDTYCSVRRRVLDSLLLDAAREAGAEVRTRFAVDELLFEDGRVCGIRGRGRDGRAVVERARVVVGADGRRSFVARALDLPRENVHPKCSFAYWSYFSGIGLERAQLCRRGRLGLALVPTNGGMHMALAFGPAEWFESFRANLEENHLRAFDVVAPELGERLRAGHREERFYGTADQTAFWRKAGGPGWLLVGDAGCVKDQCTASGMTHAFRDAALAAESLDEALSGRRPLDEAISDYARRRYLDGIDYFHFVCAQAEMNPTRLDEQELILAVRDDPEQTGRYLATYGDSYPVRKFMSRRNVQGLLRRQPPVPRQQVDEAEAQLDRAHLNPFSEDQALDAERMALGKTAFDYARAPGANLIERTEAYMSWVTVRDQLGTWPYTRFLHSPPGPTARQRDESGRESHGVNFASQDYLSLCSHPAVREAAVRALRDYGPHSAGSPMGLGNTALSRGLEEMLADLVGMEHVLLFPTGWAAGFGSIAGLVRYEDHVLLDKYAHNCLTLGARYASGNVERFEHLDEESARCRLQEIRARDSRNGILVVTEGLFSMESDWPRLRAMQELCREYGATLLVDVAHDLGALGPGGTGQLGLQGVLGEVDLVMGSFSKTFCSNGGFLASHTPSVKQYVKHFAGPHTYSNGLSPMQAAVVTQAIALARSEEGERRRTALFEAIHALRDALAERGVTVLGEPSPIVPALIGEEKLARLAHRRLFARGVGANMVEFPVVESGAARFRLQVMADHSVSHARVAAAAVADVLGEAEAELTRIVGFRPHRLERPPVAAPAPEPLRRPA